MNTRYLFKYINQEQQIMIDAFKYALQLAKQSNQPLIITCNKKISFPPSDLRLPEYGLTDIFWDSFKRKGYAEIAGIPILFKLPKEILNNSIIFAPLLTLENLRKFDNSTENNQIVYILNESNSQFVERAWGDSIQMMNAERQQPNFIPPKEVQETLDCLHFSVGYRSFNSSDKKEIKETLTTLHAKGFNLNPNWLNCWAYSMKWRDSSCEYLHKIAQEIFGN